MASSSDSEDSNPKPSSSIRYPDVLSIPILSLNECVLYAPSPNGPPPTTREKPPGCKTVFVGGLPENTTEEMLKELFEIVGAISTIRMSLKNFCHIRFTNEFVADRAIMFSGYRIKINDKDDAPNTGRLHVDYAEARDDQHEYECRQRILENKAKESESDGSPFCPPTPPTITQYSDREAIALSAKLRDSDEFQTATHVLVSWLEQNACTKKNVGYFYSMVQSTNSHVQRLGNERIRFENQVNETKFELQDQVKTILLQFDEISKVFTAASVQKAWDHFTKAQRRNIIRWKEELEEIKREQLNEDKGEEEMDMSEDGNDEEAVDTVSAEEVENMRNENDSLRSKLAEIEKKVELARSELEAERSDKNSQIKMLCENIQNVYANMYSTPGEASENSNAGTPARSILRSHEHVSESSCDSVQECSSSTNVVTSSSGGGLSVEEINARYIALVSTFLCAHPFGANIDYICSYVNEFDHTVCARDLEMLMERFPVVFRKHCTGIGASLEKKWTFCGFEAVRNSQEV